MRKDLYKEHFNIESNHFWHWGKKKIVFGLINRYTDKKPIHSLDVGCGVGLMVEKLSSLGKSHGIDNSKDAIAYCRKRKIKNTKIASIENTDFADNTFDLVTVLDVIEHIEDDKKAINELKRILKKDGIVIITVPAFKKLWSYWDELLHHKRRYNINDLRNLLESGGFEVIKMSYSNFFIAFPAIIFRLIKKRFVKNHQTAKSDFLETPNLFNPLLKLIYVFESSWIKYSSFPFGLSIVCVAKKL